MFESKAGVLFIGGLGFFAFAFLSNGLLPMLMYEDPEQTAEQVVNPRLMYQFSDLGRRYPEQFQKYFGEATEEKCAEALRLGRQIYVGEGCWHCHSQFVRPVSNESKRWGKVASSDEYQNELQRPVMFGTRRVGPDLSREGGRRGNDWHIVHFYQPSMVSVGSPMPEYPWFYDQLYFVRFAGPTGEPVEQPLSTGDLDKARAAAVEVIERAYGSSRAADYEEALDRNVVRLEQAGGEVRFRLTKRSTPDGPNKRGLAIITYVQWLGSWLDEYPYYEELDAMTSEQYE